MSKLEVKVFNIVAINYFIAGSLGFFLEGTTERFESISEAEWLPYSLIIGALLIATFLIIGLSTQKAGISVTSVSGRMSMIIPISFSLIFHDSTAFLPAKLIGIALAIVAVSLTVMNFNSKRNQSSESGRLVLPLLVFAGMGSIDALINFCEFRFRDSLDFFGTGFFTSFLFAIAGIIGLLISIFKRIKLASFLNTKTIITGVILGTANFGSVFFFIKALEYVQNLHSASFGRSDLFGLNHIGVVVLSVLFALVLFREKLKPLNWIGISLSLLALFVLAFQDKF